MKWKFLSLALTLMYATVSFAQIPSSGTGGVKLDNPIAINSIQEFMRKALEIVVQVGFPIIVLALVYTGFLFVKAQGNEDELKIAKKSFFWTVVGAIVILGAWVITTALSGTVDQLQRGI